MKETIYFKKQPSYSLINKINHKYQAFVTHTGIRVCQHTHKIFIRIFNKFVPLALLSEEPKQYVNSAQYHRSSLWKVQH